MPELPRVEVMSPWSLKFEHKVGARCAAFFFFGRMGGASAAPLDSLNLGIHSGDEPKCIQANEETVLAAMGTQKLFLPAQVHGTNIRILDQAPEARLTRGEPADGGLRPDSHGRPEGTIRGRGSRG